MPDINARHRSRHTQIYSVVHLHTAKHTRTHIPTQSLVRMHTLTHLLIWPSSLKLSHRRLKQHVSNSHCFSLISWPLSRCFQTSKQLPLGLSGCLFPRGFHSRDFLVLSFQRVHPIQVHYLFSISCLMLCWSDLLVSSLFVILS